MAPHVHRGAIDFHLEMSGDQNFTVMPEYSEDSVQEPLLTVAPPTTAVQAKARL